jgi:hypothetical protein
MHVTIDPRGRSRREKGPDQMIEAFFYRCPRGDLNPHALYGH